mmetsp:Transcript_27397/g.55304  ORF Transcript_27397/g.55304 Transcript_27397/m.55304 type:complete len:568 (-) Transcript_27397:249-1952(-)
MYSKMSKETALATLLALSLNSSDIFLASSFTPTRFLVGGRRWQSPIVSSLSVSSSSSKITSTSEEDQPRRDKESSNHSQDHDDEEGSEANRPWWKDFQLKDSSLAPSVLADFPILQTTFDGDGKILPDSDDTSTSTKRLIYLDSAATSQKPIPVTTALTDYYLRSNSNVHRGAHALSREATSLYESSRDKVAKFVNARSRNEIVFTSGATEAINLVASTLSQTCGKPPQNARELYLTEGDEVLITENEHHSNIVPWQMACRRSGATLKHLPSNAACTASGEFDLRSFEELLTPQTKLVSLQHVSNVLGTIYPIQAIVHLVRTKAHPGAKILLDACQSLPHMPVDVQSLDVDFLAGSGHKMCGPTGIGFLWGKEDVLNSLPPYMGGGEMIRDVYMDNSTYADAPARFEAGTPPIAQAVGLGAAIDYLETIGMERIHDYEMELGDYLRRRLEDVEGITVLGPGVGTERAALCAFVAGNVHPSDFSTFLDVEGVAIRAGHHCCQPLHRALGYSHSARASLYFYNTKEDVDRFVEVLEETLRFFGSLGNIVDGGEGGNGKDGDDEGFVPIF